MGMPLFVGMPSAMGVPFLSAKPSEVARRGTAAESERYGKHCCDHHAACDIEARRHARQKMFA
jgi:hypothetical protein